MKKQGLLIILIAFFLAGCITTTFAQSGYSIRISANVSGASIYIDGRFIGKTPVLYAVSAGTHQIKATAPGYEDVEQTINATSNLTLVMTFQTSPKPTPKPTPTPSRYYNLTISSNVRDASVYIDGSYKGKTSTTIKLNAGYHDLKVTARGYRDYERSINITNHMSMTATLEKDIEYHTLSISANISYAAVFINGREQHGYAPVSEKLPEGRYTIKVARSGYDSYETTVELDRDIKIYAKLELEVKYFTLSISANVRDAKVYIDGREQRGYAPYSEKLKEGKYSIKVESRGYKPYETTVYLNKDTRIYAELQNYDPTVKIEIPSSILNSRIRSPELQIDVFVDGKEQKSFEFSVSAGSHTIRIESGGLAIEEKIYFREGKIYIIKLGFGMNITD